MLSTDSSFYYRFIAQTLGRLATGHPITLLELNTFLHALCCLAIYAAWWQKPLDIKDPTPVEVSSAEQKQLTAFMLMFSEKGRTRRRYPIARQGLLRRCANLVLTEDVEQHIWETGTLQKAKDTCAKQKRMLSIPSDQCHVDPITGTFTLHYGQEILGYRLCVKYTQGNRPSNWYVKLTAEDIECLRLASSFRQQHPQRSP